MIAAMDGNKCEKAELNQSTIFALAALIKVCALNVRCCCLFICGALSDLNCAKQFVRLIHLRFGTNICMRRMATR